MFPRQPGIPAPRYVPHRRTRTSNPRPASASRLHLTVILRASDTPLETLTYITAVIMDHDLSLTTIIGRLAISEIHFYLSTAEWIIVDITERISSVVQALITNVTTAEASFAAYCARTTNGAAVLTAWKEFMVRFAPDAIRRGQDWVVTGRQDSRGRLGRVAGCLLCHGDTQARSCRTGLCDRFMEFF